MLTNRFDRGGVTNVMTDLAANLPADIEVTLGAVLASAYDEEIKTDHGPAVIGVRDIVRVARDCEVVHSHQRLPALLAKLLMPRTLKIEHVHNEFANMRLLSFRNDKTIAVSQHIATGLRQRYPHVKNLQVVHNGVQDVTAFQPRIVPSSFHVIGIGRLSPQKDPFRFLDYVHELYLRHGDLKATWYGDGPLSQQFTRGIHERGMSSFMHWVPWVPREVVLNSLDDATALMISSAWEGLPLVALEAAARGTPILSTQCGEIAELLSSGDAGVVWSADESSADFAKRSGDIMSARWDNLSANVRNMYVRQFGIETMSAKVADAYRSK